jgi:tetratricopeptide (TPR) repeat protein
MQRDRTVVNLIAGRPATGFPSDSLKEIDDRLRELKFHFWVWRSLYLFIIGGSIAGILGLKVYLDGQIETRFDELNGMVYGNLAALSGDPQSAVDEYDSFLDVLERKTLKPSADVRAMFYLQFLSALRDANQMSLDGEFESKVAYEDLLNSKTFLKDRLGVAQRWRDNQTYWNSRGICEVKFGSVKDIDDAAKCFEKALESSEKIADKAANNFATSMLFLARDDEDAAIKRFRIACELLPRLYSVELSARALDDDNEGPIWTRAARILGHPNIGSRFKTMLYRVKSEDEGTNVRSKLIRPMK